MAGRVAQTGMGRLPGPSGDWDDVAEDLSGTDDSSSDRRNAFPMIRRP